MWWSAPILSGLTGFILGTVLGSLVKALADRSLNSKSFWGRSYCPKCRHKLAWYDLFPLLSYILLKGKCRYCHKKIPLEYPVTEIILGVLVGFLFWQNQIFSLELLFKIFFITVLAILFLTDIKKMFIPDRIVFPAIVIGIILKLIIIVLQIGYFYYLLSQTTVGRLLLPPHSDYFQRHVLNIVQPFFLSLLVGVLIGGFFLSLIIITKGKGMGGGDVKLGAFMGIMLGFPNALFALVLSFLTGAVFSVGLILLGKKHFGQTIPFGPFLVLGSLIMLFWGNQIMDWYLKLGS